MLGYISGALDRIKPAVIKRKRTSGSDDDADSDDDAENAAVDESQQKADT